MAESSLMDMKNIMYFCSEEHVATDTVSTDTYRIMCRMHMPVYLSSDAKDEHFLTCKYM